MSTDTILLNRFDYCFVQDRNTGTINLHEGPCRLQLDSHQELQGKHRKIRLFDGQFAVVLNPWSAELGDIIEGEREVRVGPCVFSLRPGECLQGKEIQSEFVLTCDDSLLVRAEKTCPHPLDPETVIPPGTELVIAGPRKFIPHKDILVLEQRKNLSLSENDGVYVQNDDTGAVRLVRGPDDIFLQHNESLWRKKLTGEEAEALGFAAQKGTSGGRVLSAHPRQRATEHEAVVLDLEHREAICLFTGDETRVEFGPKTVFLGPHERPRVLHISGGVPVRPNVLRLAKLSLGPDFIRDQLRVRTADNATLTIDVTYRWRFVVNAAAPEKLFALKDFVGFIAQTLSAEIREEAARHTFESLHSGAASLVKVALFGARPSRVFAENGLEVFGIDVEGISPDDKEIQKHLAEAIKTNVRIYTKRQQDEAKLASERLLIDGQVENETARAALIALEIQNERTKRLAAARLAREAEVEKAQGQAEAIRLIAQAEREAEEERLRALAAILSGEGGAAYIALEQAKLGQGAKKVIVVPTDSRVHVGVDKLIDDDSADQIPARKPAPAHGGHGGRRGRGKPHAAR